MLTPRATGPNDSCFFYRGGMRALFSDEFEEILKFYFTSKCATTGGMHNVESQSSKMWGSQLIPFTNV